MADFMVVVLHMFIVAGLTTPIIGIMYYMEFSMSQYAIADPRYVLTISDLTVDFWRLPLHVMSLEIVGVVLVIISAYFIVVNFFEEIAIFYSSIFPESKMF
jgi:hypothetical protein